MFQSRLREHTLRLDFRQQSLDVLACNVELTVCNHMQLAFEARVSTLRCCGGGLDARAGFRDAELGQRMASIARSTIGVGGTKVQQGSARGATCHSSRHTEAKYHVQSSHFVAPFALG
jgi:hypothetical protein